MLRWLLIFCAAYAVYFFAFREEDALTVLMKPPAAAARDARVGVKPVGAITAPFDASRYVEQGVFTVVELYTDGCSGCKLLHSQYPQFLRVRPDVAVRQVHIPEDWQVAQMQQEFGVAMVSTPHILIYDTQGKLVAGDAGTTKSGFKLLYDWMNAELEKEWKRQQGS